MPRASHLAFTLDMTLLATLTAFTIIHPEQIA